jgi:signal transduction histidine kinase
MVFAIVLFAVTSSLDFLFNSPTYLLVAGVFSVAVVFAGRLPYVSSVLLLATVALHSFLGPNVSFGVVSAVAVIYLAAVSNPPRTRVVALAASLIAMLVPVVRAQVIIMGNTASLLLITQLGLVVTASALAYFLGRYTYTRVIHVGTSLDKVVASSESTGLNLRFAEQEQRFQIARELAEVILQDVTAVLSQAEGGSYAAKLDSEAAARALDRVAHNARSAHQELRRLYDQLNRNIGIQAAPPGIDDIEQLVIQMREFGYVTNLSHQGSRFGLTESAELAIYRIVFDALENAKEHAGAGSSVTIDFSWVDDGMQILVKDNGIEHANRARKAVAEAAGQTAPVDYDVQEDFEALVQPVVGPSITAMRERAALFSGAVEATRVPGVGFTVSAIFPNLRLVAGRESGS